MITPPETMFIILGTLFVNVLITIYACYLLRERLSKIEDAIGVEETGK